jgi:hypothetical protein
MSNNTGTRVDSLSCVTPSNGRTVIMGGVNHDQITVDIIW